MSRRPPSSPPDLPGFEHIKLVGTGGFADVFLYRQLHPKREVAIKVLLKDKLDSSNVNGFADEANVMAEIATHPSIVSVHEAGVSADGRPYLVMEFCSGPNLQARHKSARFSEAETLRIGIQVAGAVETAHRAHILHRDIKPANILVTAWGLPALTDFGISSSSTTGGASGMSIPWSPPESFQTPPGGDATSDVYSLAATLYTLLTNRSPFERPGGSNSDIDVIARIRSAPVPPIGRDDVSAELETVLAKAMAKSRADRYSGAMEFARALQRVQIAHGMHETKIDVREDQLEITDDNDDEGRTHFRSIRNIDAQGLSTATGAQAPTGPTAPYPTTPIIEDSMLLSPGIVADATTVRNGPPAPGSQRPAPAPLQAPAAPPIEDTVRRESAASDPIPVEAAPKRRRTAWIWTGIAAAVIAAVVVVAIVVAPQGVATPEPSASGAAPVDPVGPVDQVPMVEDLTGASSAAGVVFTWTNPQPEEGDIYLWRPVVPGQDFTYDEATEPTATVVADASGSACIEVVLRRADGTSAADSVEGCAP